MLFHKHEGRNAKDVLVIMAMMCECFPHVPDQEVKFFFLSNFFPSRCALDLEFLDNVYTLLCNISGNTYIYHELMYTNVLR